MCKEKSNSSHSPLNKKLPFSHRCSSIPKSIKLLWSQFRKQFLAVGRLHLWSFYLKLPVIKNSQWWFKFFPGMHSSVWESPCSPWNLFKGFFYPQNVPIPHLSRPGKSFSSFSEGWDHSLMFSLIKSARSIHALILEIFELPVLFALILFNSYSNSFNILV